MEIVLHKSLVDYCKEQGNRDILLYQVSYHSCGGPVKEVAARFVEEKDRERIASAGYTAEDYGCGKLYYLPGTLSFKKQLKFRLFNFMGKPFLKFSGAAPIYNSPLEAD